METYIAILRGINVSGQKKIKMADLRTYLAELKYDALQTYIQSGNILFQTEGKTEAQLCKEIKDKIQEKYDFEVPVMIRTLTEWKAVHALNPYPDVPAEEYNRLFVAFLNEAPTPDNQERLAAFKFNTEVYEVHGREVYFYCPDGAGKSKMSNNLLENKLKVKATSRNWRTVEKLMAMAQ